MSSNVTYFADTDGYPEAYCGISTYCSAEFQNVENMLDELWANQGGMKQWKLNVLHCYLCAKEQQPPRLPAVSLYNYTL